MKLREETTDSADFTDYFWNRHGQAVMLLGRGTQILILSPLWKGGSASEAMRGGLLT